MAACRGRGLRVDRPRWTRGRRPWPGKRIFAAFGLVRQWVASAIWSRPGQGGAAGLHPRPRQAATPPAYASSSTSLALARRLTGGSVGAARLTVCRSAIGLWGPRAYSSSGTKCIDRRYRGGRKDAAEAWESCAKLGNRSRRPGIRARSLGMVRGGLRIEREASESRAKLRNRPRRFGKPKTRHSSRGPKPSKSPPKRPRWQLCETQTILKPRGRFPSFVLGSEAPAADFQAFCAAPRHLPKRARTTPRHLRVARRLLDSSCGEMLRPAALMPLPCTPSTPD